MGGKHCFGLYKTGVGAFLCPWFMDTWRRTDGRKHSDAFAAKTEGICFDVLLPDLPCTHYVASYCYYSPWNGNGRT